MLNRGSLFHSLDTFFSFSPEVRRERFYFQILLLFFHPLNCSSAAERSCLWSTLLTIQVFFLLVNSPVVCLYCVG